MGITEDCQHYEYWKWSPLSRSHSFFGREKEWNCETNSLMQHEMEKLGIRWIVNWFRDTVRLWSNAISLACTWEDVRLNALCAFSMGVSRLNINMTTFNNKAQESRILFTASNWISHPHNYKNQNIIYIIVNGQAQKQWHEDRTWTKALQMANTHTLAEQREGWDFLIHPF